MIDLQVGLIGAGQIGALTAREFRSHPRVKLVAIADSNAERARSLAAASGIEHVFTDARQLIEREDIDAVYIAVPNTHHEAIACQALASNKHVLLEKPFATNLMSAEAIADAARRHCRVLMLGMNQRFERNVQRARGLVAAGRLGPVYHAKAFWRRRRGIPRLGSWFTDKATAGGGALLDIGVHVLDVALHVIGNFSAQSVSGAVFTRFGQRGLGEGGWGRSESEFPLFDVDDFATALIRLEGGVVINLEAAWALHQNDRNDHDVVLYGEDAGLSIYTDQLFCNGADNEYHVVHNASAPPIRFPHCSRVHHFVNVLLEEEELMVSVGEALQVQKIIDAIYRSATIGEEIRL